MAQSPTSAPAAADAMMAGATVPRTPVGSTRASQPAPPAVQQAMPAAAMPPRPKTAMTAPLPPPFGAPADRGTIGPAPRRPDSSDGVRRPPPGDPLGRGALHETPSRQFSDTDDSNDEYAQAGDDEFAGAAGHLMLLGIDAQERAGAPGTVALADGGIVATAGPLRHLPPDGATVAFRDAAGLAGSEDLLVFTPTASSTLAGEQILKAGYLIKKLGRRRKWKRRWFVLRGTRLTYYKNDKEYKLLSVIHLLDITSVTVHDDAKMLHVFSLGTSHGKTLYIQADSNTRRNEWVTMIQNAVAAVRAAAPAPAPQDSTAPTALGDAALLGSAPSGSVGFSTSVALESSRPPSRAHATALAASAPLPPAMHVGTRGGTMTGGLLSTSPVAVTATSAHPQAPPAPAPSVSPPHAHRPSEPLAIPRKRASGALASPPPPPGGPASAPAAAAAGTGGSGRPSTSAPVALLLASGAVSPPAVPSSVPPAPAADALPPVTVSSRAASAASSRPHSQSTPALAAQGILVPPRPGTASGEPSPKLPPTAAPTAGAGSQAASPMAIAATAAAGHARAACDTVAPSFWLSPPSDGAVATSARRASPRSPESTGSRRPGASPPRSLSLPGPRSAPMAVTGSLVVDGLDLRPSSSDDDDDDDDDEEARIMTQQVLARTAAQAAQAAPDSVMDNRVVFQGFLHRQGKRKNSWKRKWYVIRAGKLWSYKNQKEYQVSRVVPLEAVQDVQPCEGQGGTHIWCFKLTMSKRTVILCAETESVRSQWLTSLLQTIEAVRRETSMST
ncbi:hypothetical protein CXG81DRAFT_24820 [Caulochytrium protostelioides]|uniref:PH domain-containing protein n=1 Tax=Caulochytrium protostelioides TaxID=1555241 RepID=A0A4P9XAX2_9FUNG|nr:hypothetical protein CXG81DRAFT_24820 [Caulochytrium protostelioides]|eukprot:RKP02533.1 hypothetical protein CXG81DRAFT_24820 [Caulochytrium protostelioides]